MFAHPTRLALIVWLILALLLAQGLRVCIHGYGNLTHAAEYSHESTATHFEGTLNMMDGHDGSSSDVHVPLFGMFKVVAVDPLVAVLFVVLALVLVRQGTVWIARARTLDFRPPHGHYFSPPLRAPPPLI